MKFNILFSAFLFAAFCVSAQNENGYFFVETGVKLFGGADYLNFAGKTGISFNETNRVYYHPNSTSEYSHNTFSWSLAPRLGYHINKLFSFGFDFQMFDYSMKDYSTRHSLSGLFIRKEIDVFRLMPFIEFSGGLGRSTEKSNNTAPSGGRYSSTGISDLHYFSGSSGVSVFLQENLKVSFSAKIQNTIEKHSKKPDSFANEYRFSNIEIGPMLSVAYIFKRIKSNKE